MIERPSFSKPERILAALEQSSDSDLPIVDPDLVEAYWTELLEIADRTMGVLRDPEIADNIFKNHSAKGGNVLLVPGDTTPSLYVKASVTLERFQDRYALHLQAFGNRYTGQPPAESVLEQWQKDVKKRFPESDYSKWKTIPKQISQDPKEPKNPFTKAKNRLVDRYHNRSLFRDMTRLSPGGRQEYPTHDFVAWKALESTDLYDTDMAQRFLYFSFVEIRQSPFSISATSNSR